MIKKILIVAFLAFLIFGTSGCIQAGSAVSLESAKISQLENKIKALESKNSKLAKQAEKLEMQVGVYKSLSDCKEKALVAFIDKSSGVMQTTLQDAFDRCNAIFSAMKALAETQD